MPVALLKKTTWVTIDHDTAFRADALQLDPQRGGVRLWNGFLCPFFDRDAAHAVASWLNAETASMLDPSEGITARWDGGTLYLTEQGEEYAIEPDGGLYPIGGGSWVWTEVES